MNKKPLTLVIGLIATAAVFCTHIDQDTGDWSFGLPWQGIDVSDRNAALRELLTNESETEVVAKMVKLVGQGAQVDAVNGGGYLPIHLAIFGGHVDAVQWLLNHGSSVEARSSDGTQALHEAASSGRLDIVKVLLDHDANINATSLSGSQPLHYAAMGGNKDVVAMLLKAGASVTNKNEDGRTPCDFTGDRAIHDLLVAAGAERPAPSLLEATKLGRQLSRLWLTSDGVEDLDRQAKQLLEYGAKPDVVCEEGMQAIHFMIHNAEIMALLIEKGASVHAKAAEGRQPLLLAVAAEHVATVRLLMQKGANPKARDNHGISALEVAPTDEIRALLQPEK